jgi:sirohydrochlorin cobaltochelatase
MIVRTAILFAIAGSTCHSARQVLERINAAATLRFPGVEPRWCFTSAPIRRKLTAQGIPAPDPTEALAALQAEGFTRIAVIPLHLTDGMEFRELAEVVTAWQNRAGHAPQLALGAPLLTSDAAWQQALRMILAALYALPQPPPATPDATTPHRMVLVAHGSTDPCGSQTLQHAAELCRTVDPRLMLGMLLGQPDQAQVVRRCQEAGVRTVWLVPCLALPGFSAQNEIAGTDETSWASALRRAGLDVVPIVRGLAEYDGIVQLWLDSAAQILTKWEANNAVT